MTTITDNGDGTFTYVNEAGDNFTFDANEKITSLVDNGDGSFTYTSEDGTATTVQSENIVTVIRSLVTGHTIADYTNENGDVVQIQETITTMVDNGDNTYTYTNEDGDTFVLDAGETITTMIDNGDGTFTYTNEAGTTFTFGAPETVTELVDNGDGSFTYTNEDGISNTYSVCDVVDECETVTSISWNTNTSELEYIDENGDTNGIPLFFNHSFVADVNPNSNTQDIALHLSLIHI